MTQENQTEIQATAAQEQQTVQVGFEKALVMMNPEWRTAFTTEQVNQFRHYYHQGIQDINLLNNINFQNAQQNFQAVLHTAVFTGNEEQFAEFERQAAEAATAQAQEIDPTVGAQELAHNAEVAVNPIEDTPPVKKAGKAPAKGAKASKGKR